MLAALFGCLFLAKNSFVVSANGTTSNTTGVTTSTLLPTQTAKTTAQTSTASNKLNVSTPSPTNTLKITTQAAATATLYLATTPYMATTTQTTKSATASEGKYSVTSTATPPPSTEVKIIYYVNITLRDKPWSEDYLNKSIQNYRDLEQELKSEFKAKFNNSNFNLTHVSVTSFHNQSHLVMAKIILQFGKPPENEPKDPVQELKEAKTIGSYNIEKVEVKEHIPDNASVKTWETSDEDCCKMCPGTGGQVRQTRDCAGSGCKQVMKLRYVKCSSTCKTKCSAGHRFVCSSVLVVVTLLSALFGCRTWMAL